MDPDLRRQAAILYRSGAFQEARAVLTEACGADGADPQAWTLLARVERDLGDLAAARRCAQRALVLYPGAAEALCVAGTIEQRQGNLDQAVACYRRSLALAPGVAEPRFHLGELLLRRGDVGGAITKSRATLEITPDHAAALNNY